MNKAKRLKNADRAFRLAVKPLLERAAELGYTVRFANWCEDARTPGIMLGRIAGKCDYELRLITVATSRRSNAAKLAALAHELEHAAGEQYGTDYPELGLSCGNRLIDAAREAKP